MLWVADGGPVNHQHRLAAGIKPIAGNAACGTSKAAIRFFTQVAALVGKPHGIRVNSISPGAVATPMVQTRTNPQFSELACDYWAGVLDALQPSGILTSGAKTTRKQDIALAVGWRDSQLKAYFSRVKKEIGVWVACREPNGYQNPQVSRQAMNQIERQYGGELSWSDDEATKSGYCLQVFHGVDPTNRADWPRQHRFLAERIVRLHRAVSPFVATLDTVGDNGDMLSAGATAKPDGGSPEDAELDRTAHTAYQV